MQNGVSADVYEGIIQEKKVKEKSREERKRKEMEGGERKRKKKRMMDSTDSGGSALSHFEGGISFEGVDTRFWR